jgi:hypothetical protein
MTEEQIKEKAGYVQVEGFAQAGPGYFCGTCSKLDYKRGTNGYCKGLKVDVQTYGCCNYWVLNAEDPRAASGLRLTVL